VPLDGGEDAPEDRLKGSIGQARTARPVLFRFGRPCYDLAAMRSRFAVAAVIVLALLGPRPASPEVVELLGGDWVEGTLSGATAGRRGREGGGPADLCGGGWRWRHLLPLGGPAVAGRARSAGRAASGGRSASAGCRRSVIGSGRSPARGACVDVEQGL